jgi:peptidoglycan hydrolase-like protein with peptidoglycan-binding domain
MAKRGDKSSYVKDLQDMLIAKGAKIKADGDFGQSTETAVKAFQTANNLEVSGNIDTNTLNKLMES